MATSTGLQIQAETHVEFSIRAFFSDLVDCHDFSIETLGLRVWEHIKLLRALKKRIATHAERCAATEQEVHQVRWLPFVTFSLRGTFRKRKILTRCCCFCVGYSQKTPEVEDVDTTLFRSQGTACYVLRYATGPLPELQKHVEISGFVLSVERIPPSFANLLAAFHGFP